MGLRALFLALAVALALGLTACGGGGSSESSGTTTTDGLPFGTTSSATTTPETTTVDNSVATGDVAAGKAVFVSAGCGSCHVLEAGDATGTVGPNLDEQLASDAEASGEPLAEFVRSSIADPDAYVAAGFQPGVMGGNYDDSLSVDDFNNLVAFVTESVQ